LSGIGTNNNDQAAQLLARLSVTGDALSKAIADRQSHESAHCSTDPTLTLEARRAVDKCYILARDMGDQAVGGVHLLLAFLQEPLDCDAGQVLAGLGVTWQTAGRELMVMDGLRTTAPPGVVVPGLAKRRAIAGMKHKVRRIITAASLVVRYPTEPFLQYMVARTRIGANPYPFYARLRKNPFRWDRMIQQWFVTGYEDASAVLKEARFSTQQYSRATRNETELPPFIDREFRSLDRSVGMHVLFLDAPRQTRIRTLVMKQFTPRVISQMEDQIQSITDRMLAGPTEKGAMNVISDIAVPLPGAVIEQMLGVSDLDSEQFKRWSDGYIAYIGSESSMALDLEAYHCFHSLQEYFSRAISDRRLHPRADVLSLLMQAREGEDVLTDEEIIANCLLMLAVGRETTTQFIGNMVLGLLKYPDEWERLKEDPGLIPGALEEILRYESPVQWTVRIAREDFDWNGRHFDKGCVVNIAIGGANRDPAQFSDPDRLDVRRTDNKHIAFGYGPHFCLGASLARLEGQVVLRTLLQRFPNMQLQQDSIQWKSNTTFRAVKSLQVSLTR